MNKEEKDNLFEKAALVKRLEQKIIKLKEQEENAYDERKILEAEREIIRDEIKATMIANQKIFLKKTGEHVIKIKKGNGSVVVKDEMLLPSEFKKIVSTIKIDKMAIREKLLSGKRVIGAELEIHDFLVITG